MKIAKEHHIKFFEWQIQVLEEEWARYAKTSMSILIKENRLFVGRIWGIQQVQGNVILRFKAGAVPRMKQPYLLCLVGPDAPHHPSEWTFSYLKFRNSIEPRLSSKNTEVRTLNYFRSEEEEWSYIIVSGFDLSLLTEIKGKFLDKKHHPLVIIAETDPPIDYLLNLKEYVEINHLNKILNLNVDLKEEDWHPQVIDNKFDVKERVLEIISKQDCITIQGPPGTGKSYLAAELCDYFIRKGKSVCVTALTNKALMEIADKDGLSQAINEGIVFKTNLTSDESKKLPKLKSAERFSPINGELLLSTYYKLSQKQKEIVNGTKRFDLLIIEEASQAFLATIAMFSSIAKKILIIGDHKQLTPVVIKKEDAKKIDNNIEGIINGLQTISLNTYEYSYRLVNTRRLTSEASKLTGLYYDNSLVSISNIEGNTKFNSEFFNLFHFNGGISIAKLPSSMTRVTEKDLVEFICNMAIDIMKGNKDFEVALLTPYINIESKIYERFSKLFSDYSRITINTIHKIQGLTSDVSILFLPLRNPNFDLDANLFNVATSRAKRGTLIITYKHIELISGASFETINFVHNCKDVTPQLIEHLGKSTS